MIVLTAPTGDIGRAVVAHVLAAGRPVRLIVRDPAKLPADVRQSAEIITGSHGDPAVVDRAFAGADAVFWLAPPNARAASLDDVYVGFTRPAADAVRRHHVACVVDITALGRTTPYAAHAGHVTASLAMDDLIASTGVAFRALAMPSFMDNLLRQIPALKAQGVFSDVVPSDHRAPAVATRDIASVAARFLLDASWTGQSEVPVLGPEDLSPDEMAATMSDVLGTPIRYQRVPLEPYRQRLTTFGMSPAIADGLVEMMVAKGHGLDLGVRRTPQNAIDTPTTFRQWCTDTLKPAFDRSS